MISKGGSRRIKEGTGKEKRGGAQEGSGQSSKE